MFHLDHWSISRVLFHFGERTVLKFFPLVFRFERTHPSANTYTYYLRMVLSNDSVLCVFSGRGKFGGWTDGFSEVYNVWRSLLFLSLVVVSPPLSLVGNFSIYRTTVEYYFILNSSPNSMLVWQMLRELCIPVDVRFHWNVQYIGTICKRWIYLYTNRNGMHYNAYY